LLAEAGSFIAMSVILLSRYSAELISAQGGARSHDKKEKSHDYGHRNEGEQEEARIAGIISLIVLVHVFGIGEAGSRRHLQQNHCRERFHVRSPDVMLTMDRLEQNNESPSVSIVTSRAAKSRKLKSMHRGLNISALW
jgi:hypothetical protein